MNTNTKSLLSLLACGAALAGCSVGMAPEGMSDNDAKAAIAKMTPEQKIKAIASSPMPGPEKQKRFEEIERETGVKASDVLGAGSISPGAGAPTAQPGG